MIHGAPTSLFNVETLKSAYFATIVATAVMSDHRLLSTPCCAARVFSRNKTAICRFLVEHAAAVTTKFLECRLKRHLSRLDGKSLWKLE
jgi:hypothetical protein